MPDFKTSPVAGGLPRHSVARNIRTYGCCDFLIETVLARDVLQMAKIAEPALLRHLFALAATPPAQLVSYTKMLGQLPDADNTTSIH